MQARGDGAGRSESLGWADESEWMNASGVSEGTARAAVLACNSSEFASVCKRSGADWQAGQEGQLAEIDRT